MSGLSGADSRSKPPSQAVRRIMQKHGLPEPSARSLAQLAYGEAALNGR